MKRIFYPTLIALVFVSFWTPSLAQDCSNEVVATLTTALWGDEVSYTLSDDNGVLVVGQGLDNFSSYEALFCADEVSGCLVLEMTDNFGDGWNGAFLEISLPALGISLGTFTLEEGAFQVISFGEGCDLEVVELEGCTDPFAFNFDPYATLDDGTCSYDCTCDDVYEPVCAFNYLTGDYATYNNACEAQCAQALVVADGTCEDQPVYGCTDEDALNYNPEATDDDGSCAVVLECGEGEMQVLVTLETGIWADEVSFFISDATGLLVEGQGLQNNAFFYASFCLTDSSGCLELEMIDSFGDGWNGATVDVSIPSIGISLGTFTLESGFHQAISFGLDCETEVIQTEGCTDPSAFNFDPYASLDDGSCSYECECEDVYEPVCGFDYATGSYVTFNNLCEASCLQALIVWEGDCADQPLYGCTDESAVNYNPDATQDDGSCVTIPTCGPDETALMIEVSGSDSLAELGIDFSIYWSLTDSNGVHADLVYAYSQFEMATSYGCLADGCYNFYMYDYGWGQGLAQVEVTLGDETTTYVFPDNQFEAAYAIGVNATGCEVFIPIYGCTDSEAMNFNSAANVDDGNCLYPCECEEIYDPVCAYDYITGEYITFNNACEAECWNAWLVWNGDCANQPIYGCTDSEALNYDGDATDDDGSCAFIPVCDDGETEIVIQTMEGDSLDEFGLVFSLHWTLTTDLGQAMNLVYDYNEFQTTSYGCLADGCYNFHLSDYGWVPGMGSVEVLLDGEASATYSVDENEYSAVFALSVNADGCEVTQPGCTDPEALNYSPSATVDDGSCQYPFICETGEVGYVYLSTNAMSISLNIASSAGELVFSDQDAFNFGFYYGEICLEPGLCYTAIVTGAATDETGLFGVSTAVEDLVYAEWPIGEGIWVIQFGLDGPCEGASSDWESLLGCTDSDANNYDPEALIDDGSCLFANLCGGLFEVEFLLEGGLMPDEVGLHVTNDEGDLLMEMDGYTGSSVGCVPAGCYTVEMLDAFGDGWNGAQAELFIDGELAGTMTLEEGNYEVRIVGVGVDCEDLENEGNSTNDLSQTNGAEWILEVYPNPGQDQLSIRSHLGETNATVTCWVYNADGRLITETGKELSGADGSWLIDASSWAPGMYIVHVALNNQTRQVPWFKVN